MQQCRFTSVQVWAGEHRIRLALGSVHHILCDPSISHFS